VRILFFCQYYPPEICAPAARTHEHARRWAAEGHSVTVVCGLPSHPTGVVPEAYRGRALIREEIDGVEVLRCWLYATPNRGAVRRSLSFFSFMCSSVFWGIFRTGPCDVVAGTSPQMLCALGAWCIAAVKRRPFVLEVRDLWPKQIIDLGVIRNPVIIRLLKGIEMFLYRRAARIVPVAPATGDAIAARGIDRQKICTITNGIQTDFFEPGDRMNRVREEHGWGPDRIVALYIGTHGLSQGLDTVLDAAAALREREEILFVFAGEGAEKERLKKKAAAMELGNTLFLPVQPKAGMPEWYNAADICLVPLKKREVFLYNIPSKMFEIMACARPMVLGAAGQARDLLETAAAGIAVPPEDSAAFAAAIEKLADNPELRAGYGRNGRAHAERYYDRNRKAEEYLACLETVAARKEKADGK
jgi:glycosyltransferase involved in cell wall biosynthesis